MDLPKTPMPSNPHVAIAVKPTARTIPQVSDDEEDEKDDDEDEDNNESRKDNDAGTYAGPN